MEYNTYYNEQAYTDKIKQFCCFILYAPRCLSISLFQSDREPPGVCVIELIRYKIDRWLKGIKNARRIC